eukprot:c13318_g1_i4.p1 GENE.c13318_g1_i4~~c13318_g1_i4.p1  ORF type:complete len:184 (+),score=11.52 c13318_g1_i4:288-839(+)
MWISLVGGRRFSLVETTLDEEKTQNPQPNQQSSQHHPFPIVGPLGEPKPVPTYIPQNISKDELLDIDPALDKPFVCKFSGCTKTCLRKYDMQIHIRSHTGERPFKCPFPGCKKAFAQSGGRSRHIRVHTGERPFTCRYCNKKFTESCHRTRHEAVVCPARPNSQATQTSVQAVTKPSSDSPFP